MEQENLCRQGLYLVFVQFHEIYVLKIHILGSIEINTKPRFKCKMKIPEDMVYQNYFQELLRLVIKLEKAYCLREFLRSNERYIQNSKENFQISTQSAGLLEPGGPVGTCPPPPFRVYGI